MENATDALKIAFAIFVFVLAITVTFGVISQAKSTADTVLYYSDDTNFYEHLSSKDSNRIVSVSEVISTLYRYYKESLCVTIDLGNENTRTFDLNNSSATTASIEKDIAKYVESNLLDLGDDAKFTEEFVEIPISGIYDEGEDGSEIILSSGGNKVYVTYTLQQET